MTAMPAQKIGVLAMTNAMEAMRAPMSMTITQVQAAGLLPWPRSMLWSMPWCSFGAAGLVPETVALLM